MFQTLDQIAAEDAAAHAANQGGAWTPPSGCVGWWYGNNTEGDGDWTDATGNGLHATLAGDATVGSDGVTMSGGGYAAIGTNPLSANTDFTLATWVYWNSISTVLLGGGSLDWWLYVPHATTVRPYVGGSNTNISVTLSTATWTHVVMVWHDATQTVEIYIDNGTPQSDSIADHVGGGGNAYFGVDSRDGVGYNLDGKMDDAMIFDSALTSGQVADIYNNSLGTHKAA